MARYLNPTECHTHLGDKAAESKAKTWPRDASEGRDSRPKRGIYITRDSQLSWNEYLAATLGPFGAYDVRFSRNCTDPLARKVMSIS
jgi:hypothetical protein